MIGRGCSVVVLGSLGVGKTSLCAALTDNRMSVAPPFPYSPTLFPECSAMLVEADDVSSIASVEGLLLHTQRERKRARATLVDTPGDKDMEALVLSACLTSDVLVCVVDRDRPETVEYVDRMLERMPRRETIVVACKEDEGRPERGGCFTRRGKVLKDEQEAARFLAKHQAQYLQVSLVTGAGVRQLTQAVGKAVVRCSPAHEERKKCH